MTGTKLSTYKGPIDLGAMTDAVSGTWRLLGADSQVHVGNMSWRLSGIDLERPSENIGIWRDASGRVVGLALIYDIFPIDIFLHAEATGRERLLDEMLDWTESRWAAAHADGGRRPPLRVGCLGTDMGRIASLTSRSYKRARKSYLRLTGRIEPSAAPSLPSDLSMRVFRVPDDVASLVALHDRIFSHTQLSAERVTRSLAAPWCDRDLGLVVEHGKQGLIGFAFGWLDQASGALEFEPVACHPDWRRRGIGRALLEAIKGRALDRGARIASLTAPADNAGTIAFYHALGFQDHGGELEFVKAIG